MNLTLDERTKIFDKVCRLVETKHFNPAMNGADWDALVRSRRDQILACSEPEAFEKEVNRLVAELKTSHTGFRHAGMRNIPARHAINATLHRLAMNGTERWMFQDVHRGGPAYLAGIRPGDLLLGTGEREIRPPEDLTFFRRRISAAHHPETGRRSTGSQPSVAQAQVQETSSNRP